MIIPESLNYYDKNTEEFSMFIKKIKSSKIKIFDDQTKNDKILFYDNNDKIIFKSRIEVIGIYNNNSKTWIWAWSVPQFKQINTMISRDILNYGLKLSNDNIFLKYELLTSRFRISDETQLDIHMAIASYLSKQPFIFKHIVRNEKNPNDYSMLCFIILDYDKINTE